MLWPDRPWRSAWGKFCSFVGVARMQSPGTVGKAQTTGYLYRSGGAWGCRTLERSRWAWGLAPSRSALSSGNTGGRTCPALFLLPISPIPAGRSTGTRHGVARASIGDTCQPLRIAPLLSTPRRLLGGGGGRRAVQTNPPLTGKSGPGTSVLASVWPFREPAVDCVTRLTSWP